MSNAPHCPQCKGEVTPNDRFCTSCGSDLRQGDPESQRTVPSTLSASAYRAVGSSVERPLVVKGYNAIVEMYETELVIRRRALFAMLYWWQWGKGPKRIRLSDIASVKSKEPNWITNGYIRFQMLDQKRPGGLVSAALSEDGIIFTTLHREGYDALLSALGERTEHNP